jgi:hypothetical protein
MKKSLLKIKFLTRMLTLTILITACDGGSSSERTSEGESTESITDLTSLNGQLTVRQDGTFPTIGFTLKNGIISNLTTIVNGREAKAHPNGRIVFSQTVGCPDSEQRLSIKEISGLLTAVTPCSRSLNGFSSDNYTFYSPEISPDNTKVAVALTHSFYFSDLSVAVFDMQGELIALHKGYAFPTWHPDGYLLLAGREANTGIYKTSIDLQNVTRIDDGKLTSNVVSLDVDNEAGQKIVFAYNAEIWTMDINNADPKRLPINSTKEKVGAAFSPNGKHIVFLNKEGRNVLFYEFATKKTRKLEADEVFGSISSSPLAPLSWVK